MRKLTVVTLAALALAAGGAFPGRADAQQYQWKLQSLLNPGHMGTDAEIWFAQEVEKAPAARRPGPSSATKAGPRAQRKTSATDPA